VALTPVPDPPPAAGDPRAADGGPLEDSPGAVWCAGPEGRLRAACGDSPGDRPGVEGFALAGSLPGATERFRPPAPALDTSTSPMKYATLPKATPSPVCTRVPLV